MIENYIVNLNQVKLQDLATVGGKNASLGEMIQDLSKYNIKIPQGFALTTTAYTEFLRHNNLAEKINDHLEKLDISNINQLEQIGEMIRSLIMQSHTPPEIEEAVREAIQEIQQSFGPHYSVAVRSSATAEDLPQVSFAGLHDSFLNVSGSSDILIAIKKVYASLYNNRAISYRVINNISHSKTAMSVGIQKMINSEQGASGVMFTIDTETGFDKVIFITSIYGLGEPLVKGLVNPDEFYSFKPSLEQNKYPIIRKNLGSKDHKMIFDAQISEKTRLVEVNSSEKNKYSLEDREIIELSRQALSIEKHYQHAMDIEWSKDGITQEIYIIQARPETVKSFAKGFFYERYYLKNKGRVIAEGKSIGQKIANGRARVVHSIHELDQVKVGDILVAEMTDPDWEPIMKLASAIVTDRGGRTCHAAIVARELGLPTVIGCGNATKQIPQGKMITVSCAEGEQGFIYEGMLNYEKESYQIDKLPKLPVKLLLNVGNPASAFEQQRLPNDGVGLARLEFIIAQMINIHPKACLEFSSLPRELRQQIADLTAAYPDPVSFYVDRLSEGIATIAAAFWPKIVIVRFSDFKSNEYANLLGGEEYEPKEANPMLGFRGASRYVRKEFSDCFELECRAVKRVREKMGLLNINIMIPFVRTLQEAKKVVYLLDKFGLKRGQDGLAIWMMCEIPSNVILANAFLEYFDGFSIGSNDLTQLTLGIDRDSEIIASEFDERDPAMLKLFEQVIDTCRKKNKHIGICGQAPSDYPDLAQQLIDWGITSLSINPDSIIQTWLNLGK